MNSSNINPKNSMNCLPLQPAFVLIALALACFAVAPAPKALGVTPAPDGGYPNNNTAEGTDALFSWPSTTGAGNNTAIGFEALHEDNNGVNNTAIGVAALFGNTSGSDNTATGITALENNISGSFNTAIGFDALRGNNADDNTAI